MDDFPKLRVSQALQPGTDLTCVTSCPFDDVLGELFVPVGDAQLMSLQSWEWRNGAVAQEVLPTLFA